MPNANTHDTITFALVPFTYLAAELYWHDTLTSILATAAMLFAGLMFGPDLDLMSRPYRRWGPFRFLWKPYQMALPHRSKFSHGPILGTVIRLIYFLLVFSAFGATVLFLRHNFLDGRASTWQSEWEVLQADWLGLWRRYDRRYFAAVFAGLWLGALSHTTADITWSSLKRRRRRR